jgi:hypothetical protein
VLVRGVAAGARVTLDGVEAPAPAGRDDERAFDAVRVGKHVVEVMGAGNGDGNGNGTFGIDVEFNRTTEVIAGALRAAPTVGGAPLAVAALAEPIAIGGVVTGLAAVTGALVLWIVSAENRDEWQRRAAGLTFPRNSDDPACAATNCVVADDDFDGADEQVGWTRGYGPLGDDGQVGQGARFMMVALSRDNELRWDSLNTLATGLGITAGVMTVASSALLLKLATDPDEAPASAPPDAAAPAAASQ